jgi:hypothetical protein
MSSSSSFPFAPASGSAGASVVLSSSLGDWAGTGWGKPSREKEFFVVLVRDGEQVVFHGINDGPDSASLGLRLLATDSSGVWTATLSAEHITQPGLSVFAPISV